MSSQEPAQPAPDAADPLTVAPLPAPPKPKRKLMFWLRMLLIVAVVIGAAYQLVTQWNQVSTTLLKLPWGSLTVSMLAVFVGIGLSAMVWQVIVADLGAPIGSTAGAQIYLVGQLGKYIPGTVFMFLLQMEMGRAKGISRARIFTASLVAAGMGVVASLILGLLALPMVLKGHTEALWLFGLLPVGLVFLHPRILTWLVSRVLRLLGRQPLPHPLTGKAIVTALLLSLGVYAAFGAHLWLITNALGSPGPRGFVLCVGAYGVAMTAGLLAFFLPSGIGVRDGILVAALATSIAGLSSGEALALAVVSRLMFTVADIVAAGGATLIARLRDGGTNTPAPSAPTGADAGSPGTGPETTPTDPGTASTEHTRADADTSTPGDTAVSRRR